MKSKILIVVCTLLLPNLAFSVGLGEVAQSEDKDKLGYIVLTVQQGCKSGKTKDSGARRSCNALMSIPAPAGYRLLGQTAIVTPLANKGTGGGCGQHTPVIGYDTEGAPIITAVSASMNARSEKGGILREFLQPDLDALVKRGLIGPAGALLHGLGSRGSVVCMLTISAKKI